jgi:hypothetical protein
MVGRQTLRAVGWLEGESGWKEMAESGWSVEWLEGAVGGSCRYLPKKVQVRKMLTQRVLVELGWRVRLEEA